MLTLAGQSRHYAKVESVMFLKNYLNEFYPDKVYLIHLTTDNVYLVKKTQF